ncbi:MAG: hypothetical protein AB7N80_10035 [Bdellovibrionales bacterium]
MIFIVNLLWIAVYQPASSQTEPPVLNCLLAQLDDRDYFKESFSIDEFPSLTASEQEVMIGILTYGADTGDEISFSQSPTVARASIRTATHDLILITVTAGATGKSGIILVSEAASQKPRLIGRLKCK